jgi:hypothetical protein
MNERWKATLPGTIQHGVGGWRLEEMDWDADSGLASFLYRHSDGRIAAEFRPQPTREGHLYWEVMCLLPYGTLTLTDWGS